MELSDTLRTTLEKTRNLSEALEFVSNSISPRKSSTQCTRRLFLINRELKNLSQTKPLPKMPSETNTNLKSVEKFVKSCPVVNDSPGYITKRKLSNSIKEINERVKMSRAGKRIVGGYMSADVGSPRIVKNLKNLKESQKRHSKYFGFEEFSEKLLPYVPLTNARIEDPIVLPTFEEFLKAKGVEFVIKKGSDELLFRIEKAIEKILKLKDMLEAKTVNFLDNEEKKGKFMKRLPKFVRKVEKFEFENKKNHELRRVLNQYYEMPRIYSYKTDQSSIVHSPRLSMSLSIEAEENLEESLRSFYRIKALENKKLFDILEKITKDRPYSIREKLSLIQEDHGKYKNKNHSIEKFNDFRSQVEQRKRARQFQNLTQGLVYFEILDEFKIKKHEPSDSEIFVLEVWRKIVETGWVVDDKELEEIKALLTAEELKNKPVQYLIAKLKVSCGLSN